MADYYPLISRAIAGLTDATPALRRSLYDRARTALISQLENATPPLGAAHIERERAELEAAIARVEIEATARSGPAAALSHEPAPAEDEAPEPLAFDASDVESQVVPPAERARPRAPEPMRVSGDRLRIAIVAGAALFVVAGIAAAAILFRQDPSTFTGPIAEETGTNTEADRKLGGRLGEPLSSAPEAARTGRTPAASAVPVAQRAMLFIEPPTGAAQPISISGRALWRADEIQPEPGRPLEAALTADVDVADARLRFVMSIRRNRDAALPASHTIEMRFTSGGEAVKEAGVPLMKADEAARGVPLAGVPVPVTDNFFIVGLSNIDADIARNIDLITTRGWIELPLRFADGKRAALVFEKGLSGDRALLQALERWK